MNHRLLVASAALLFAFPAAAQWELLSPAASPSPRAGHGMACEPVSGNVILFGGDTGAFPNGVSNQTWSWNGATWTQLQPATSPPVSAGIELVFDNARGVFVTFGSMNTSAFGGASANRTWEFDGTTWTQVFPTGTPGGLGNYGMAYDLVRSRTVLYGGVANSMFPIAANGTWEYDGTQWYPVATAASPGPLERPAMCFHALANRTVLFGGIDPQTGGTDTTWLYDGTNWSAAAISGARPAPRTGAKLAYDSARGVCVLTGGLNPSTGAAIVDTWELDLLALTWTQVPSVTSGRYAAGLAFVPGRRQVVQFGGRSPSPNAALGDTREYGAKSRSFGAGCAGSNGVPALTALDAPRLGDNYTLSLNGLVPSLNVGVVVLSLQQLTPTPLDSIGMPGCNAYVSPDAMMTVNGAGGSASLTVAMPANVALMGTALFAQGLSLDPAANAAWLVASNAQAGVLGR
jgi:hypothetical protein